MKLTPLTDVIGLTITGESILLDAEKLSGLDIEKTIVHLKLNGPYLEVLHKK